MKLTRLIFLLLLVGFAFNSFGQKAYTFKRWRSNEIFEINRIIFQIDTTATSDETKLLLRVAIKIGDNLKSKGITTQLIPYPKDTVIDKNTLCLKLEMLNLAYVKLNTFESEIPLCFRIGVTQTQPQIRRKISTDISISVAKKKQGIEEVGVAMAERLLRHFKL
jgi:hypothetical protein